MVVDVKHKQKVAKKVKKKLYEALLRPRMIEEKMLLQLRKGKISKWFSGIGQEAISVGVTEAINEDEKIFTMHRNLGVFTSRNVPLDRLFSQWEGKKEGYTKGRDRSFHFGASELNIIGMISHLGPQLSLANGVALAYKLKNEKKLSVAFTGEGGTSQGEFHEALNVASVWKLPVIFVVENNMYALSTPTSEQYACENLADRAKGYGMKSIIIDGNNVEEVYSTITNIAKKIRKKNEPWLVECKTFRSRGHEESSGQKYVPKELITEWEKNDPLKNYEQSLIADGILDHSWIEHKRKQIKSEIEEGLQLSSNYDDIIADTSIEIGDIYKLNEEIPLSSEHKSQEMRFIDAISDGLKLSLEKHHDLVIMGQDIAEYGGVFKITEGMVDQFGKDRIRNTPLCESGIVGISMGLSIEGIKSVVEMQFADFVTCGFNQIINNLAKSHYRWGQNADTVIRMPTGAGVGAGPFHSQSNEAWFFHTPGLKVVYPSSPADAKGLLMASISDPNPVMFFEHKALYRSMSSPVPLGHYEIEIGKARLTRLGTSASIITYGMGVIKAGEMATENNWNVDILDLRTLLPLDYNAIAETVMKTNKVLILHEDCLTGGIGGEIAAYIAENHFDHLDAPVIRLGSLDTPIPFNKNLEKQFLPFERLKDKMEFLLAY